MERNTRIRASQLADIRPADITAYATNSPSNGYVPSYDLTTGKWTWVENTGGASGSSTYTISFVNGDLVSGILTVTHNLGMTYPLVSIFDNNNKIIIPDEIEYKTTDTVDIDLSSFGTLTGTWNVRVVGGTWSQDIIKDADNDTKIQVEESTDEDIIRFDVFGSEMLQMTSSGISGNYIKDEDNMVSDSALHLSTQQSIKAYVDTSVAGLSPDKISEGDSLVEVVDLGTGYVKVEIDGIETARFGDGTTEELLELVNAGTNHGLLINQTGVLASLKYGLQVTSTVAQTNSDLVWFQNANASTTRDVLRVYQSNALATGTVSAIVQEGTGYGLQVIQYGVLATNKSALIVYSNAAQVNGSLVTILQENVSSTKPTLEIVQYGTGAAININQIGTISNGNHSLIVASTVAQTTSELVWFQNANASTTRDVLRVYQSNALATGTVERIVQEGTGTGLKIHQNGVLNGSQQGLGVYSNAIQVNSPLIGFTQDNASSDQSVLYIDQNGTGYGIEVDGTIIVKDKLVFTQTDSNEYIDSLADGYLDLEATIGIRFRINTVEQINLIDGKLVPTTDDDISLGDSTHRFKELYLMPTSLYLGDTHVTEQSYNRNELNIMLNAFRIAVNGSLTQQNMVDGVTDEFEDETGIDTVNSTNENYDSVNNLYSPTVTLLDYMEYTTDTSARTAYVSSDTIISSGSIDDEDMADITDWTDLDTVNGISSQVTFNGKSCMKLDSGTPAASNCKAVRKQDIGTFGTRSVFSFNLYCEALGTIGNIDFAIFDAFNGTTQFSVRFASDGLFIVEGTNNEVGTNLVVQNTWQEWTFDVNWTTKTVDVYLNKVLVSSDVGCNVPEVTPNGTTNFSQLGYNTSNRISYIDWFKAGSDAGGLECFSESTIKQQGSYSLGVTAIKTDSLNDTLTKSGLSINLTDVDSLTFDARASRTGTQFELQIHDSGGTTTTKTVNIVSVDTWQTVNWDISAVANIDKDNIDSIIIKITNADAENTIYIDNFKTITNNMTLISNFTEAEIQPSQARIVLFEEDVDSITINTDLKAYISRDDGTTWSQVTLTDEGNYATNQRILTGTVDVSAQPADKTMKIKIETLNNKDLKLHGQSILWD